MEFPISRERLRNIRKEIDELNKQKALEQFVEQQSNKIIDAACRNEKQYIITLSHNTQLHVIDIGILGRAGNHVHKTVVLTKEDQIQAVEQLKLKFPDCEYIIDPLQTYILVQW